MAKANTTKAADKADPKASKTKAAKGAEQVSTVLDAPKPDPNRKEREDDLGRRERQTPKDDINARDDGKDTVYGIAGRARWGGTDSIHDLSQDAQAAEESAAKNRE